LGRLFLFALVCFPALASASVRSQAALPAEPAHFDAPWSPNELAPVTPDAATLEPSPAVSRPKQTAVPTLFLLGAVKFYQVAISPADGSSCMLYPTCSGYSVMTLRKHGPILGFVMTSERVMRNHTGDYYPAIWKFGRWRNYDPVEANDFWFPGEKAKTIRAWKKRAAELEGRP